MLHEHARDDDGNLIGVVPFDEQAVEQALGEAQQDLEQFSPNEIEAGLKFLRIFLTWGWQNGNVRANGLGVRFAVLCWVFLEDVKNIKQSKVAREIGKDNRQSFNRWVINFRDRFGLIKQSSKSDKARRAYSNQRAPVAGVFDELIRKMDSVTASAKAILSKACADEDDELIAVCESQIKQAEKMKTEIKRFKPIQDSTQ